MDHLDDETFSRFAARFARIEPLVPEPPRVDARGPLGPRIRARSLTPVLGLTGVVVLLAVAAALVATAGHPLAAASPSGPTAVASAEVSCLPWRWPLPSVLAGDPCPSAADAVEAAVAPLGKPITRIRLEPGPFWCDAIWSPPMCAVFEVISGTELHGWVSLAGTDQVAAVAVTRSAPGPTADSTPGPWRAVVVVYAVPPDGWVMPSATSSSTISSSPLASGGISEARAIERYGPPSS